MTGRSVRVVVVEDEPLALARLCDLLEEQPGVEVVARAASGREGLAAAAAHRPDALFLDVEMPGMSGTELMHALREPRPDVVFVTAYPQHAVEAFAGGAVHYLLKPVSRVGVAQALSRLRPKDDPLQAAWLRIPARRRSGTRLLRPEEVDALVADLGTARRGRRRVHFRWMERWPTGRSGWRSTGSCGSTGTRW